MYHMQHSMLEYKDTLYSGPYQFVLYKQYCDFLDSEDVILACVAQRITQEPLPFEQLSLEQLLNSLEQPHRERMGRRMQEIRMQSESTFEDAIWELEEKNYGKSGEEQIDNQELGDRLIQQEKEAVDLALKRFREQELLTLDRDCFDAERLQNESHEYSQPKYLRSFVLNEADDNYIEYFCRCYAEDPALRAEINSGQSHRERCNDLFLTNISGFTDEMEGDFDTPQYKASKRRIYNWFDQHIDRIWNLPDFQRIYTTDIEVMPHQEDGGDLPLQEAIQVFSGIPGVQVRGACQGSSGTVQYQDRKLHIGSDHEDVASIEFSVFDEEVYEILEQLVKGNRWVRANKTCDCNLPFCPLPKVTIWARQSNERFQGEILPVAEALLRKVQEVITVNS